MTVLKFLLRHFTTAELDRRPRYVDAGEVMVDSDKAIGKIGPGSWPDLPGIGHRTVYDIRDHGPGVTDRATITDHLTGTIAAAPAFATVYIPPGDFSHAPVIVNKPLRITGGGHYHTRLRALPGSTGWLWTFERGSHVQMNHAYGLLLEGLFLDGGGRVDDIGGLRLDFQDRFRVRNMRFGHFLRAGVDLSASVREGTFSDCYWRHCGYPLTYAQINIAHNVVSDGANNLHFTDCFWVASHGTNVRLSNTNASAKVRNLFLTDCMLHGLDSEEAAGTTMDGYDYTDDPTKNAGPNIEVRDARGIHITACRVHNPGPGHPNLLLADRDSGGGTTEVGIDQGTWALGPDSAPIPFTAAAPNLLTATGHGLWGGELVAVETSDTLPGGLAPDTRYWVIRVDEDTLNLASSYVNAMAGIPVDVTDAGTGTHDLQPLAHQIQVNKGTLREGSGMRFEGQPNGGTYVLAGTGTVLRSAVETFDATGLRYLDLPSESSADPAAPDAGGARLFVRGGEEGPEACIRFATGDPVVIATEPA